jgi:hypothetical protein
MAMRSEEGGRSKRLLLPSLLLPLNCYLSTISDQLTRYHNVIYVAQRSDTQTLSCIHPFLADFSSTSDSPPSNPPCGWRRQKVSFRPRLRMARRGGGSPSSSKR